MAKIIYFADVKNPKKSEDRLSENQMRWNAFCSMINEIYAMNWFKYASGREMKFKEYITFSRAIQPIHRSIRVLRNYGVSDDPFEDMIPMDNVGDYSTSELISSVYQWLGKITKEKYLNQDTAEMINGMLKSVARSYFAIDKIYGLALPEHIDDVLEYEQIRAVQSYMYSLMQESRG